MIWNEQKRYFKKKLLAVQYSIWDLEFKRFKLMETREGFRKQYDEAHSRLDITESRLIAESEPGKGGLKETSPGDYARLEDDKIKLGKEIEAYEKQMDQIDVDINGAKPSADYPQGLPGINQQLDAYRELASMIKEYLKEI